MYPAPVPGLKRIFFNRPRHRLSESGGALTSSPPPLVPEACAEPVNAPRRFLLAFDGSHPYQHDEPLRLFTPSRALAMPRQFWAFGHPEKFKKVCAGAFDPLLRNHAPRAAFHAMASSLAHTYKSLPQLGLLVKLSDFSNIT
jgi:hypothetical protein